MEYFQPKSTHDAMGMGYEFRPEAVDAQPVPWPEGVFNPMDDQTRRILEADPGFSSGFARGAATLTAVIRPKTAALADVIGVFNLILSFPLVSDRTRALIEELAPEACSFLPSPPIWDARRDRHIPGAGYWLTAVTGVIDGLDAEASEINRMVRRDGSVWYSMGRRAVVDEAKVAGAHLWRDAVTMEVFCSELFRDRSEALGLTNLYFAALPTG